MPPLQFTLRDEFIELNKLLKIMGVCESSGSGKALVATGIVRVDGEVELRKTRKVRAGSVVTIEDTVIQVSPP